jgi:hypothetical protein
MNVVALRRKRDWRASTSRTVVALRRGHLALLVGRLSSNAPLLPPSGVISGPLRHRIALIECLNFLTFA